MSNFRFYGVIGCNGVAVMTSWSRVQRIRQYIHHATCKGFNTFHEAEDWALGMFADWFPRVPNPPDSLLPDQAVFLSALKRLAEEEGYYD